MLLVPTVAVAGWRNSSCTVYHVTSLSGDGTGSGTFRDAVAADGDDIDTPRIVVFDIGGMIRPTSRISITRNNLYIAGQTAPGGITIAGAEVRIPGTFHADGERDEGDNTYHDICIRHVRFYCNHLDTSSQRGSLRSFSAINADRLILDHCSFMGSSDESPGFYLCDDVTLSHCVIFDPALCGQGGGYHDEGNHHFGPLFSYSDFGQYDVHHCLLANVYYRMPNIAVPDGLGCEMINNVFFNWEALGPWVMCNHAEAYCNYEGNSMIAGASSVAAGKKKFMFSPDGSYDLLLYRNDNDYHIDGSWEDWTATHSVDMYDPDGDKNEQESRWTSPTLWPITRSARATAYTNVLANAGAWPRDAAVRKLVADVANLQSGGSMGLKYPIEHFSSDSDGPTAAANDDDRDGMNDTWEDENGYDKTDATDFKEFVTSGEYDGFMAIEWYLETLHDAKEAVDGTLRTLTLSKTGTGAICPSYGRITQDGLFAWGGRDMGQWYGQIDLVTNSPYSYNDGSIVVLRARPTRKPGYDDSVAGTVFSKWDCDGEDIDEQTAPHIEFPIGKDLTIDAVFTNATQRTITTTVDGTGTVWGGGDYDDGEVVTLIAYSTGGTHDFKQWNQTAGDAHAMDGHDGPILQFHADGDYTWEAEFEAGSADDVLIDDFDDQDLSDTEWGSLTWILGGVPGAFGASSGLEHYDFGGGDYGIRYYQQSGGIANLILRRDTAEPPNGLGVDPYYEIPDGTVALAFDIHNKDDGADVAKLDPQLSPYGRSCPFEYADRFYVAWKVGDSSWGWDDREDNRFWHHFSDRWRVPEIAVDASHTVVIPLIFLNGHTYDTDHQVTDQSKFGVFWAEYFLHARVWDDAWVVMDDIRWLRADTAALSWSDVTPVAHAGADQTTKDFDSSGGETILLDGTKSICPDGEMIAEANYDWSWTDEGGEKTAEGPTALVTIEEDDGDTVTVTLTITDGDNDTDTDTVDITIAAPP